jgi:hypothetical protein
LTDLSCDIKISLAVKEILNGNCDTFMDVTEGYTHLTMSMMSPILEWNPSYENNIRGKNED